MFFWVRGGIKVEENGNVVKNRVLGKKIWKKKSKIFLAKKFWKTNLQQFRFAIKEWKVGMSLKQFFEKRFLLTFTI